MPKTRQYFQIDRPDVADLTTTINDYVLVPFPLDRETTRNYWDTWHLAGEHPPFAATMADLTRLKERNRILSGGIHDK